MRSFMMLAKALAEENRVRTLMALREGELCVCKIMEVLGLAPSTVSKHMSILYQAGLVDSRKEGRWVYYRLAGEDAAPEVRRAIEWVCRSLSENPDIQRDAERLEDIVQRDPEELCKEQSGARESRISRQEMAESRR